ncbi:MAG TPA: hypothetical protein PKE03_06280 [Bacteroidales bacterium]|nr:hypothetical protein [Bacteroidales bacterium]
MNRLILLIVAIILFSCSNRQPKVEYAIDPNNTAITVKEVKQTPMYSYILGKINGKETWIAVTADDVETGKTYYFSEMMEMTDFHSKELDQTFESILFVGNLSSMPIPATAVMRQEQETQQPQSMGSPQPVRQDVMIKPVEGSISLQELWEKRESLAGKVVKVTGQVAKFNPAIMGRNWVHIQDGTGSEEFFDLTVTTLDMVAAGEVVVVEGTVVLNKDLGSGYFYDILLEDAKVIRMSIQ